MPTINARLKRVHLQSPQPKAMAEFYAKAYALSVNEENGVYICRNNGRQALVSQGAANQVHYALFGFHTQLDWQAFQQSTRKLPRADVSRFKELPVGTICFEDPEGHNIAFCLAEKNPATSADKPLVAYSQHFAFRTMKMPEMISFYSELLGFDVSDNVRDETGDLRACFLRTDELHHALALFKAPVSCFDHQSFEAPSWEHLKNWADHMSSEKIEIAWGVGRHGPGNDVFFMIRDLDQNLVEISAELEVCSASRPVGEWKHEERTLNLWGKAILRS
jgi:catechol 2,3-dioxygenase